MADKEVDDLTEASTLDGEEWVKVTQGGNSRKARAKAVAFAGFMGALVKKAADLTGQNLTASPVVTWDTEVYDTGDWHEGVTNPSRLTVPAGVTMVQATACIKLASVSADQWVSAVIRKNGAAFVGGAQHIAEAGVTTPSICLQTGIVEVVEGDYFELGIQVESDTTADITAANSWLAIEKVA